MQHTFNPTETILFQFEIVHLYPNVFRTIRLLEMLNTPSSFIQLAAVVAVHRKTYHRKFRLFDLKEIVL